MRLSDEALAEMLTNIYNGQWGRDTLLDSQILAETQAIFSKAVSRGVPRHAPHRATLRQRLTTSTDVFSVFRVHRSAQDIAKELTDPDGKTRPFAEWAERVQPYLNHQNRTWLETEYNTALRRAGDEAEWDRYAADKDIFPCLEWIPTTAHTPGQDHKIYWGTILPVDDPFWNEHRPGDRWNCQCSLRQTTRPPSRTPTAPPSAPPPSAPSAPSSDDAQQGLRTQIGSGEVFSDDHAYFPPDCRICLFGKDIGKLRHLLGGLVSRRGKNNRTLASSCYECEYRKKCMENRSAKTDETEAATIVDDVVSSGFSKRPPAVVGTAASKVIEFLQKQKQRLKSRNIYLTQERTAHALRKFKTERGTSLTKEETAKVCDYLRGAEAYYDPSHKNLIYIAKNGDRLLKFVVQINYKIKKIGIANVVVTAGLIRPEDLKGARYTKIK